MRQSRGLGPFSGGQLTVIIVTFALLLLFPIGAWAVSGSNVFVTDAASGQHASVNTTGALNVAQAGPKSFFYRGVPADVATFKQVIAAPPGRALVVTSIAYNVFKATVTGANHFIGIAVSKTNNTCAQVVIDPTSGLTAANLNPATVGETVTPFQPGLVVPAGRALCAFNIDPTNIGAEVYAYGFTVAAAAAPTGAAATSGSGSAATGVPHRQR